MKLCVGIILFTLITNPISLLEDFNQDMETEEDIPITEYKSSALSNHEELFSNIGRVFTKNNGQLNNDDIRFYAQDGSVWFTDDGMWMELRDYYGDKSEELGVRSKDVELMLNPIEMFKESELLMYKRVVLKQEFVEANSVKPIGNERLSWNSNCFYGNDSSKWYTEVPNYGEVYYENLYDGIDLRYYSTLAGLKYDLILHPGADPEQIRVKYEGADRLNIDNKGNMLIQTEIGTLIDGELFIYQEKNGIIHPINGRFIQGNNKLEYKFEMLENYDKEHKLIIDPHIKLDFSTYIGGSSNDDTSGSWSYYYGYYGDGIAVDSIGNSYVTGVTSSSDFPTTPGVFKNYLDWYSDGFIFKLDKNGAQLLFSTFVGGSSHDYVSSIAVDAQGCSYIAGSTNSSDFPVTSGIFNTNYSGKDDCFALKLNHNGSKLIFSTFIGGSSRDVGSNMVIDETGNSYISGTTYSIDFPTTSGAYNESKNSYYDLFVLKLDNNGSNLLYSTYIGGNQFEVSGGITIDQAGNVYVTGITNSSNFPTTPGAFDRLKNGITDCIVFKLNPNGSALLYSTYIGGDQDNRVFDIALDSFDNAIIVGWTNSSNFPVVNGSYDTSIDNKSYYDGFITKINSNGSKLIFSSFIGGRSGDYCCDIAVDSWDYIYVTGVTLSTDFPLTPDAVDKKYSNIVSEGFLLEMNADCSDLMYSTFIGGIWDEVSSGIVIDHEGNVLVIGGTYSPDFNTTFGAYDTTHNGGLDIFVQKYLISNFLKIESFSLLKNNTPTNLIYSRLGEYTFRIIINNTFGFDNIEEVKIILNSSSTNIQLHWDSATDSITKLYDPNDFIELEPSSNIFNLTQEESCIDFNITFNWTFPNEGLQDVKLFVRCIRPKPVWYNLTDFFRVENDLVFNGQLLVKGEDKRILTDNSLVRGGEYLTWKRLTPVYEGTTDVYPPADEFDIIICDENNDCWSDSPKSGESLNLTTITPKKTINSYNYTINLTGIPHECDKTNKRFTVRIDNENITFIHLQPYENEWQVKSKVNTSVKITDHGGGFVDNKNIMHSISEDNGSTWSAWTFTEHTGLSKIVIVNDYVTFEDGDDNFIKWQAKDIVGNGPSESEPYRILVDTNDVLFSNPIPSISDESSSRLITVGITISDSTSGVNASMIKYSFSTDGGTSWGSWRKVGGYQNGKSINIRLNLTFPNGTNNRIKWSAYDIAGNGPAYSDEYVIKVNIPKEPAILDVQLLTPENNSIISKPSVELSWRILNTDLKNVKFDIYLGFENPPKEIVQDNLTVSNLLINELDNNRKYYWTVVPKTKDRVGSCISGVWSFSVEIPTPRVKLTTPENGSVIKSISPTLIWELDYNGSEKVTYELYFGTTPEPEQKMDKIPATHFSIFELDDNTTYYWYIVPWAGEIKGPRSEVWWFTVNLGDEDFKPDFDLDLMVYPSNLEMAPGGKSFAKATITNFGNSIDNASLKLWIPAGKGIDVLFNGSNTTEIAAGDSYSFDLTVIADIDAKEDTIQITIVAESDFAKKYNLTVREFAILTIAIKESIIGNGDSDKSISEFLSWNILTILILIIVLIIILIVILNRKKIIEKKEDEQKIKPNEWISTSRVPDLKYSKFKDEKNHNGKSQATSETMKQLDKTDSSNTYRNNIEKSKEFL